MIGALTESRVTPAAWSLVVLFAALAFVGCAVPSVGTVQPTMPIASNQSEQRPASLLPARDTPPPLNRLETKVVDALAKLGVAGQRAELPFGNAAIWAQVGTGSQLFANAAPTASWRGEFTVIDDRRVDGIRVQRVRYANDAEPRRRFECAGDTYEVRGVAPAAFADMDAFVAQFIRALGCGRD